MPQGFRVILWVNAVLLVFSGLIAYAQVRQGFFYLAFVSVLTVAGLLVTQLVIALRWGGVAIGLTRGLLYAVALAQGLGALLLLRHLFSWAGLSSLLLAILVVVYVIGVRGYLNGPAARQFFVR